MFVVIHVDDCWTLYVCYDVSGNTKILNKIPLPVTSDSKLRRSFSRCAAAKIKTMALRLIKGDISMNIYKKHKMRTIDFKSRSAYFDTG